MRWSGVLGCFAGFVATLLVSTFLQLHPHEANDKITPSEEYVGRLEAAYEAFLGVSSDVHQLAENSLDTKHTVEIEPANSVDGITPAPTSTIVVVQTPSEKTSIMPHLSPSIKSKQYVDNNIPSWIRRQIPCAGTGSQFCARPLEPAVPFAQISSKTQMLKIPEEWFREVERRDLIGSLEKATQSMVNRNKIVPNVVCPPHWSSCHGGRDTDSSCTSLLSYQSRDKQAAQILFINQFDTLFQGIIDKNEKKNIRIAFTVFGKTEIDIIDEIAVTAKRLKFGNVLELQHETGDDVVYFFAVAIGQSAIEASCRAGIPTIVYPDEHATLAMARYHVAAYLSNDKAGGIWVKNFWSFLPDVFLLRHPDQSLPFLQYYDIGALLATSKKQHLNKAEEEGGGHHEEQEEVLLAEEKKDEQLQADLLVGLRFLPDQAQQKSSQNPAPDSGLFWCKSTSKLVPFFKDLAIAAEIRQKKKIEVFFDKKNKNNKKSMILNYDLYGSSESGEVDEEDEIEFKCSVYKLKHGPWKQLTAKSTLQDTTHSSWSGAALSSKLALTLQRPPPYCSKQSTHHDVSWGVLDPKLVVVDDMHPRSGSVLVASRVPGGGTPGGRAAVKEIGLWEGSNCYYCVGNISQEYHGAEAAGANRKFLIYDSVVATNAEPVYHRIPMSIGILSQLVALAMATDRILVLPAVLEMQKWTHAWEYLDMAVANKLISWRPASFFDHLHARRFEDLGWSASKVTASQMMLRGRTGISARRLSNKNIDEQEEPTWYKLSEGKSKSIRLQEYAVARNSPQTTDATLLFVRFRRKTDSLILQPCATNPAVVCKHQPPRQQGWIEFNIFTALHWCHYQTKLAVRNGQKEPDSKREWEHHDRNKFGAFMKPVDECSWPKRTVWPTPSLSLSSFSIPKNGHSHHSKTEKALKEDSFSWLMASKHPCYRVALTFVLDEIEQQGVDEVVTVTGGGVTVTGNRDKLDALAKASWIQHEWVATQMEVDIMDQSNKKAKNDNVDKTDFVRGSLIKALGLIKEAGLTAIDEAGECESSIKGRLKEGVHHFFLS